ncbi:MAG: hypothetical protein J6N15_12960 [Ruminiclostridium sp.]|nr:hypothetical protein [Ruminiclostridium sp.]
MKKLISVIITLVTALLSFSVSVYADAATDEFGEYLSEKFENYVTSEIDISGYVRKNGWDMEETCDAIASVYYSHPEFFFVHNGYKYAVINDNITSIIFEYDIPKASLAEARECFDAAARKVVEGITDDMTDVDKALYVHDYLILNCRYDTAQKRYSAYNCLIEQLCVCQGYTLAYEYILNEYLGIPCSAAYSDDTNHIWNYVKIGNNWYHVDLTLDDLYDSYNGASYDRHGFVSHKNFLMSDTLCKSASDMHKNWKLCDKLPAAGDNSFDKAFWRNINSKINYADGKYYYISYGGKDGGKNIVNVCRYDLSTQKNVTLARLKCVWYSRRGAGFAQAAAYGTRVYSDIFSSIEYMNGKLYFNSNKTVYSYNLSTKKLKTLYTLNKGEEMQLFGLAQADGKLRLVYRKDLTYPDNYLKLQFR